jgi:hypothetical protein
MSPRSSTAAALGLVFLLMPATVARATEAMPKALSCDFSSGSSIAYTQGAYETAPAKPLAFVIGDIDLEAQRATLKTNSGQGKLSVVRAVNANHFLEVVTEGFLNLTTVYDLDPRRNAYPAVHSRHLGLFGEPVIAQYYGFCKANS